MYLYWAGEFSLLRPWAGLCDLKFFPGDDPDALLANKKEYDAQLAKRKLAVEKYLLGGHLWAVGLP